MDISEWKTYETAIITYQNLYAINMVVETFVVMDKAYEDVIKPASNFTSPTVGELYWNTNSVMEVADPKDQ